MTESKLITVLVQMTPEQRAELDTIARVSELRSRNAVIRQACQEFAARFSLPRRPTDETIDVSVGQQAA